MNVYNSQTFNIKIVHHEVLKFSEYVRHASLDLHINISKACKPLNFIPLIALGKIEMGKHSSVSIIAPFPFKESLKCANCTSVTTELPCSKQIFVLIKHSFF